MVNGYIKQSERKKILLLCDDLRFNSGVATMAKEFVIGTAHRINWVTVGALLKHPEQGKRLDLSGDVNKTVGIDDSYVHLIPYSGYGNATLVRQLLNSEQPDGVMIFTDPRYWIWLFDIEREIRSKIPLIYLNIWDNYPAPFYNRPYYEACDLLMAISKQTKNINEIVLGSKASEKVIKYVPHGIDSKKFYPISNTASEFEELKKFRSNLNIPEDNFVVFWNSRNITRKRPADVIRAFRLFVDRLPTEAAKKCTLLMHTDPVDANGTNLLAVKELFCGNEVDVRFSTSNLTHTQMNYLYNIADVTVLISANEGWGLSLTESMMAGRMIIANVTGGMQDQMRFVDENGKWINFSPSFESNHRGRYKTCGAWAIPVFPADITLAGSIPTPYIFDDRCNVEDVADAILQIYSLDKDERTRRGLLARAWVMSSESGMSAANMSKNVIESVEECIAKFKPRAQYDLINVTTYQEEKPQYKEPIN